MRAVTPFLKRLSVAMRHHGLVLMESAAVESTKQLKLPKSHDMHTLALDQKTLLVDMYRRYLETAVSQDLPIALLSPTLTASAKNCQQAGLDHMEVNENCVQILHKAASCYRDFQHNIFFGGLVGPCGGTAKLDMHDSHAFHAPQIETLSAQDIDFLIASTIPAIDEARGIAKAMAETNKDYIVSFSTSRNGTLLDGTPVGQAIKTIDGETAGRQPCFYMLNCIHPRCFDKACKADHDLASVRHRVEGLQADLHEHKAKSKVSPKELVRAMFDSAIRHKLALIGGFGVVPERMSAIAQLMAAEP